MGGASLCSFCSSAAYSGGSRSGMVAMSCATFIIGPFEPAERGGKLDGLPARSRSQPSSRDAGDARRDAAHFGADPRIARGAGGEAVLFAVRGHDPIVAARTETSWHNPRRFERHNVTGNPTCQSLL